MTNLATTNLDDSVTEQPVKRIRYAPPDLRVVVGQGDETCVFSHYALELALASSYVDAALCSNDEKEISFPDITPAIWRNMTAYLQPRESPPSAKDLLNVVEYYCKYEFDLGVRLCDNEFSKTIDKLRSIESNLEELNDLLTRVCAIAYSLRLDKTRGRAENIWTRFLRVYRRRNRGLRQPQLPVKALARVVPMFKEAAIWNYVEEFFGEDLPEGTAYELTQEKSFPLLILKMIEARVPY